MLRLASQSEAGATLTLEFAPRREPFRVVRRLVERFHPEQLGGALPPRAVQAAIVALIENVMAHAQADDCLVRLAATSGGNGTITTVRTRNRASLEDVDRMRGQVDALAHGRVRATGVARLCARAGMSLYCITDGDYLDILARVAWKRNETSPSPAGGVESAVSRSDSSPLETSFGA